MVSRFFNALYFWQLERSEAEDFFRKNFRWFADYDRSTKNVEAQYSHFE